VQRHRGVEAFREQPELEWTELGSSSPAAPSEQWPARGFPLPPAAVLSLQRAAGNAAVTALLLGRQRGQTLQRLPCGAPGHPASPANIETARMVNPAGVVDEQDAERSSDLARHRPEPQRTADNAAIVQRPFDGGSQVLRYAPQTVLPHVIQRCGTTPCDCPGAEKPEESEHQAEQAAVSPDAGRYIQRMSSTGSNADPRSATVAGFVTPLMVQRDDGCAQKWQSDTTCLYYGVPPSSPPKKDKHGKPCCNTFPPSVQDYAISNGWDGTASCDPRHKGELATVSSFYDEHQTQITVLCADTMAAYNYVPKKITQAQIKPAEMDKGGGPCGDVEFKKAARENKVRLKAALEKKGGKLTEKQEKEGVTAEVIELSKNAWGILPGRENDRKPVSVTYTGGRQDNLCTNEQAKIKFPKEADCISDGCYGSKVRPSVTPHPGDYNVPQGDEAYA
jgi:hypothetical protein